jgi:hypothetical protein
MRRSSSILFDFADVAVGFRSPEFVGKMPAEARRSSHRDQRGLIDRTPRPNSENQAEKDFGLKGGV